MDPLRRTRVANVETGGYLACTSDVAVVTTRKGFPGEGSTGEPGQTAQRECRDTRRSG